MGGCWPSRLRPAAATSDRTALLSEGRSASSAPAGVRRSIVRVHTSGPAVPDDASGNPDDAFVLARVHAARAKATAAATVASAPAPAPAPVPADLAPPPPPPPPPKDASVAAPAVCLAVMYKERAQQLVVSVVGARDLPAVALVRAVPDAYAKLYVLPDPDKRTKRKTRVATPASAAPTWNETFVFAVAAGDKDDRTLECSVWDAGLVGDHACLGRVAIPLSALSAASIRPTWWPLTLAPNTRTYGQPCTARARLFLCALAWARIQAGARMYMYVMEAHCFFVPVHVSADVWGAHAAWDCRLGGQGGGGGPSASDGGRGDHAQHLWP
jgi:hypothetical protein